MGICVSKSVTFCAKNVLMVIEKYCTKMRVAYNQINLSENLKEICVAVQSGKQSEKNK